VESIFQSDNLAQSRALSNQKWALMAQKKFKTVKDAMLGCLNHAQEVWGGDTPSFQ
jgi:hypothetical protein